MKRRTLLGAVGALAAALRRVEAQDAVRRIGILVPGTVPLGSRYPEPLMAGLRELGWIEGQNLSVERRIADDQVERLPAMALELVASSVELIVTVGTPAALAARKATATLPIVMATIGDPVSAGLVQSLARPGGNVTGNTFIEPDLGAKRLQLLKELLPAATRIGELMNPANPALEMLRAGEAEALKQVGLQAVFVDVASASALDAAFDEFKRQRVQALVVHADSLFLSNRARIMALALQQALPSMAEGRAFVEAGALISYAPSSAAMMRNAAVFVDRIFKGARPAELPVQRPTRIELVVNLKTAKALGIEVPTALRLRADEVIE
jgi:putative tryptophan/tyrosine transport system substrate-binding protein